MSDYFYYISLRNDFFFEEKNLELKMGFEKDLNLYWRRVNWKPSDTFSHVWIKQVVVL